METCWKWRCSGPTLGWLNKNLQPTKISGSLICIRILRSTAHGKRNHWNSNSGVSSSKIQVWMWSAPLDAAVISETWKVVSTFTLRQDFLPQVTKPKTENCKFWRTEWDGNQRVRRHSWQGRRPLGRLMGLKSQFLGIDTYLDGKHCPFRSWAKG